MQQTMRLPVISPPDTSAGGLGDVYVLDPDILIHHASMVASRTALAEMRRQDLPPDIRVRRAAQALRDLIR